MKESEINSNKETSARYLSDAEVKDLLKRIGDSRLRANEDSEHFTLHLGGRVRYVPKRTYIRVLNSNQEIEDFLREALAGKDYH